LTYSDEKVDILSWLDSKGLIAEWIKNWIKSKFLILVRLERVSGFSVQIGGRTLVVAVPSISEIQFKIIIKK
jgi:hypothetical protein